MLNRCMVLMALVLLTAGFAAAFVAGQTEMGIQNQSSDDEAAKKAEAFLAQWDKNVMPGCAPPFDSPQQLNEYAGTYYDELDADHKITLDDNGLVLKIGENFENPLTAAAADYFTIRGGAVNLSFTRDDKGKITGFVFNSALDD